MTTSASPKPSHVRVVLSATAAQHVEKSSLSGLVANLALPMDCQIGDLVTLAPRQTLSVIRRNWIIQDNILEITLDYPPRR